MPTGYTDKLCKEDLSFTQFVLTCARAFGPLITMRDDSLKTPIPSVLKTDSYYQQRLEEAKKELIKLEAMTLTEADLTLQQEITRLQKEIEKETIQVKTIADRLFAMRKDVEEWAPPTSDHNNLKLFMLKQLDETIKYDGTLSNYNTDNLNRKMQQTGQAWLQEEMEFAEDNVKYYQERWDEELEITKKSNEWNEWIEALRNNLKELK